MLNQDSGYSSDLQEYPAIENEFFDESEEKIDQPRQELLVKKGVGKFYLEKKGMGKFYKDEK